MTTGRINQITILLVFWLFIHAPSDFLGWLPANEFAIAPRVEAAARITIKGYPHAGLPIAVVYLPSANNPLNPSLRRRKTPLRRSVLLFAPCRLSENKLPSTTKQCGQNENYRLQIPDCRSFLFSVLLLFSLPM